MEKDIYIDLIYKGLESSLSEKEQANLANWEKASKQNSDEAKLIRDSWNLAEDYKPKVNINLDKEYNNFQKTIGNKGASNPAKIRNMSSRKNWMRYAAIGLLLIGVATALTYFINKPGELVISDLAATKTEELNLSDKSSVILREGAKLRYPNRFQGDTREVGLFGEAYFDIAKNRRPFVINVEHGKIEVVGTAFNVKTHYNDIFSIKVKEGKVRFTSIAGEVREANGGEAIIYYFKNNKFFTFPMNPINMDSWTSNTLVFDGVPFENVAVDLNEHFNANIQIEEDVIKKCLFSSTFKSMEMDDILETIRTVFQLDGIDRFDTIIALRGGTCPNG